MGAKRLIDVLCEYDEDKSRGGGDMEELYGDFFTAGNSADAGKPPDDSAKRKKNINFLFQKLFDSTEKYLRVIAEKKTESCSLRDNKVSGTENGKRKRDDSFEDPPSTDHKNEKKTKMSATENADKTYRVSNMSGNKMKMVINVAENGKRKYDGLNDSREDSTYKKVKISTAENERKARESKCENTTKISSGKVAEESKKKENGLDNTSLGNKREEKKTCDEENATQVCASDKQESKVKVVKLTSKYVQKIFLNKNKLDHRDSPGVRGKISPRKSGSGSKTSGSNEDENKENVPPGNIVGESIRKGHKSSSGSGRVDKGKSSNCVGHKYENKVKTSPKGISENAKKERDDKSPSSQDTLEVRDKMSPKKSGNGSKTSVNNKDENKTNVTSAEESKRKRNSLDNSSGNGRDDKRKCSTKENVREVCVVSAGNGRGDKTKSPIKENVIQVCVGNKQENKVKTSPEGTSGNVKKRCRSKSTSDCQDCDKISPKKSGNDSKTRVRNKDENKVNVSSGKITEESKRKRNSLDNTSSDNGRDDKKRCSTKENVTQVSVGNQQENKVKTSPEDTLGNVKKKCENRKTSDCQDTLGVRDKMPQQNAGNDSKTCVSDKDENKENVSSGKITEENKRKRNSLDNTSSDNGRDDKKRCSTKENVIQVSVGNKHDNKLKTPPKSGTSENLKKERDNKNSSNRRDTASVYDKISRTKADTKTTSPNKSDGSNPLTKSTIYKQTPHQTKASRRDKEMSIVSDNIFTFHKIGVSSKPTRVGNVEKDTSKVSKTHSSDHDKKTSSSEVKGPREKPQ